MVQIVDVSIKCYLHDDIAGPYLEGMSDNIFWKMDIYGILAIRDPLDDSQNYIFLPFKRGCSSYQSSKHVNPFKLIFINTYGVNEMNFR
jgi:hypothetical protein